VRFSRGSPSVHRGLRRHIDGEEAAARHWQAGSEGELGERQEWCDRAWMGTYERNRRLDLETLTYAPQGLARAERPRSLEPPAN